MVKNMMRYDVFVQAALRGVVRDILREVGRGGLPGEHHFYIAFFTMHPDVDISDRLRERYPGEMTIVLQHQFWDLSVTDSRFEVNLSFNGEAERLSIPFTAIRGFYDPSVQFALEFDHNDSGVKMQAPPQNMPVDAAPASSGAAASGPAAAAAGAIAAGLGGPGLRSVPSIVEPTADSDNSEIAEAKDKASRDAGAASAPDAGSSALKQKPASPVDGPADAASGESRKRPMDKDAAAGAPATPADVVSLEAFRKGR